MCKKYVKYMKMSKDKAHSASNDVKYRGMSWVLYNSMPYVKLFLGSNVSYIYSLLEKRHLIFFR